MYRFLLTVFLTALFCIGQAQTVNLPVDSIAPKVLHWLQTGQSDSLLSICSPEIKSQLPASAISSLWNQLELQVGTWQKSEPWQHDSQQGLYVYHAVLHFKQGTLQFNVVINAERQVAGFTFTPVTTTSACKKGASNQASSSTERDITIKHGDLSLPGTLTLPAHANGKVPVVVMVQGSGPSDRDETVGPNKPFRDLAQALAEKGIASIRYDKRTYVYGKRTADVSNGVLNYDTEVTEDAVEALALASQLPEADASQIFLLGHSLGGTLAPRIAAASRTPISGIIFMAAMARPFWTTVKEQLLYLSMTSADATLKNPDWASQQLDRMKASLPQEYLQMVENYNATAEAQALPAQQRMLFLQGGHDYQVTEEDLNLWKKALSISHPQAKFLFFEKLDHLMRPLPDMAVPQDYQRPEKMSEEVADAIARFVRS